MKKCLIGLLLLVMTGCGQSNDNNLVVYNNEIDIKPGLIENNLGGLDLSSVTQVQNKLEDGWENYSDDKLGFSIDYPLIWKDMMRNSSNPTLESGVTWLLGLVPESVMDFTPQWQDVEDADKKTYAVVAYGVYVTENKQNLATMELFDKIVGDNLNPVEVFDVCWTNQKIDENWIENGAVMIGGLEAVKTDWMTCPPGAGGKKEVILTTKDKIYAISMTITAPSEGDSQEWENLFEQFYQTFRIVN